MPDYIRRSRSGAALWSYFKSLSPHWQPRREHIWSTFEPLLDHLEDSNGVLADTLITDALGLFDPESVQRAREKALERRHKNPDGAITSARTLLETVCKRVLDEVGGTFNESDDLPKLYHAAAEYLNLAPSQHIEEVFRSILGNCQSVVNNLGTLRNKILAMGASIFASTEPVKSLDSRVHRSTFVNEAFASARNIMNPRYRSEALAEIAALIPEIAEIALDEAHKAAYEKVELYTYQDSALYRMIPSLPLITAL